MKVQGTETFNQPETKRRKKKQSSHVQPISSTTSLVPILKRINWKKNTPRGEQEENVYNAA